MNIFKTLDKLEWFIFLPHRYQIILWLCQNIYKMRMWYYLCYDWKAANYVGTNIRNAVYIQKGFVCLLYLSEVFVCSIILCKCSCICIPTKFEWVWKCNKYLLRAQLKAKELVWKLLLAKQWSYSSTYGLDESNCLWSNTKVMSILAAWTTSCFTTQQYIGIEIQQPFQIGSLRIMFWFVIL